MVYGIAKMLNFAHGDVIMIGSYVIFMAITKLNLPVIVSALIGVVACTLLGVIIEKLAYKPLRNATSLSVLITAIGVSYFLQNGAQLVWTSSTRIFPTIIENCVVIGELSIPYLTLLTILICSIIMFSLMLFINKTKTGKALRACSEDKGAASLMGINVDKTISLTFAIGSGLAAVASLLLSATYPAVNPTMGSMPGIKAFTAAVFGGIGSLPGAFLGGVLLGIIEILAKAYISTELSDAIVFLVLIIVLLIKPAGLLGTSKREKV